jgi:hypothetical protein
MQAADPPPPTHKKSHPAGWLWLAALLRQHRWNRSFYLASSYFGRELPPNYRRRCCVSHPSSRWIGVGPQRHGHQDRKSALLAPLSLRSQESPENCIGFNLPASPFGAAGRSAGKDCRSCMALERHRARPAVLASACTAGVVGQALGLLVLLRFTHCCAST